MQDKLSKKTDKIILIYRTTEDEKTLLVMVQDHCFFMN
jgi:hypothetical protein